jgi:hypothetical protein
MDLFELENSLLPILLLLSGCALGAGAQTPQSRLLVDEGFESDLSAWSLVNAERIEIIPDPAAPDNHVIQLTPEKSEYTHAIYEASKGWSHLRIEGRFLFPAEGDGYLGLIYNYQERDGRKDFGCIYVKSNGNYIRVSPHHDGNPSWRLYEELKVELTGARRIEVGRWNQFRLDVVGHSALLFLADMETPILIFDWLHDHGAFGLEARPGGGTPVWVDDLKVTRLDERGVPSLPTEPAGQSDELLIEWEIQGPFDEAEARPNKAGIKHLNEAGWRDKPTDERGAVIAALNLDTNSSPRSIVYLRTKISSPNAAARQLALSTVNKLQVWVNGEYLAEVEPADYIWSDLLTNPDHAGTGLKIELQSGENEIVIRLDGERFAGGGFFAALIGGV